jgi:DNA-binding beta-propeller fold protein YncE
VTKRATRRGAFALPFIVLGVTGACILGVVALLLRHNADPGIRVWLLNHQPDQAIIVNPFNGQIEREFLVADGLRELAFSDDFSKAYIANVVDVSNRLKVLNTTSYLEEDEIEVDGVPQGIGVFPGGTKLAVILGSKTDFMAGGFDVIDLAQRTKSDPHKRKRLYRERGLALTHKIAVGDDGDRIYVIDAKKPLVNIYSFKNKGKVGVVDLHGSPEHMLYPRAGDSYFVSVLQHYAVYEIDKQTDQIKAAYVPYVRDPRVQYDPRKLKHLAVDKDAHYLFSSSYNAHTVYVWRIGDPNFKIDWALEAARNGDSFTGNFSFQNTREQYLPITGVKLKGGWNPGHNYDPEPEHVAVDAVNQNLFVTDSDGALYIYTLSDVLRTKLAPDARQGVVVEPYQLVHGVEGEMRDLKVSRPAVRKRGKG